MHRSRDLPLDAAEASEVLRLRRRLERERQARQATEAIAESVTRELYERQRELKLLEVIAKTANQENAIEQVLQVAVDEICSFTGWPVGHTFLVDQHQPGQLLPTAIWHLDDVQRFRSFRRVTESMRLPSGIGLPGRVLATGEAAWISDIAADDNFPRRQLASDLEVVSGFAFPVLAGLTIAGVLEFYCDKPTSRNDEWLDLMLKVGVQLGRAMERMLAEHALRQSEARLENIMETIPDIIYTLDTSGRLTRWNKKMQQVIGYSAAELMGKPGWEIFVEADQPAIIDAIRRAFDRGYEEVEGRLLHKDGSCVPYHWTGVPLEDGNGRVIGLTGAGRDVTERKRAEEEIRRLNADLERRVLERTAELAAANKELEAFSYSVSHDLRGPLRGIDGFSQALLDDYGDKLDDEAKEYLRLVRAGTQEMAQLIDDLLGLARVSRADLHRQRVDLSALAAVIVDDLRKREPQRRVNVIIEAGLMARGDARLLRLALENLLANAWKYSRNHSAARIEVGRVAATAPSVFFVRDDGAGFDNLYADKLFGAFQRLHAASEFEGIGIGLATVQRIVRRHGGRIWAEGAVEKGATFYFTLESLPGAGQVEVASSIGDGEQ